MFPHPGLQAKAERETAVQSFCVSHGFPAARVLHVGDLRGFAYLVIEHATGPQAVAHLIVPWRRRKLYDALAVLQTRLHRLPTEEWPAAGARRGVDEWLSEVGRASAPPHVAEHVEWLRTNRARGVCDDLRVCHLDFHVLNVLMPWKPLLPTVIDWDMAALADPHADLAVSLEFFSVGPAALKGPARAVARLVFRSAGARYLRAYQRYEPVDIDRLTYWRAMHCVVMRLWLEGETLFGITPRAEMRDAAPVGLADYFDARFETLTA
jgi:aminoglycoside phosphotransferase (APT) family kinase protein